MNQPGAVLDIEAQERALLKSKQNVQSTRDEYENACALLQEAIRVREEWHSSFFQKPDAQGLVVRIEQLRAKSQELQKALREQEGELHSLNAKLPLTHEHSITRQTPHTTSSNDQVKEGKEAHTLRERIAQGHQNLASLKASLVETQRNLDKTECQLSPIRLLPVEVLAKIFCHCKESTFSSLSSMPIPPPLTITHTCSLWRSLAINEPELWSNIQISINSDHNQVGWLSLVQLWLERSKGFPLSFSISETSDNNHVLSSTAGSAFFRFLDLFMPLSQRWKIVKVSNIVFAVPGVEWFSKMSGHLSFPLLESMALNCHTLEATDSKKIMGMLEHSPRLHTLFWHIRRSSATPTFPWAQLTVLDLNLIISFHDVLRVLLLAQRLTFAKLNSYINLSAMHDHHVTHKSLQKLHLGYEGDLGIVLDSLTLPNITAFGVHALPARFVLGAVSCPWPQAPVMSFLRRSNCKLQSFSAMATLPGPSEVLAILQHLSPTLVEFELRATHARGISVTNAVLLALTYPSPTDRQLDEMRNNTPGEDILHTLIESRLKAAGINIKNELLLALTSSIATTNYQLDEVWDGREEEFASVLCPRLRHIRLWGCMDSTDGMLADMVISRLAVKSRYLAKLRGGHFGVPLLSKLPQDEERLANLYALEGIKYVAFDPEES